MQIRELEAPDLDGLLDLYEHLHEVDAPRPQPTEVEAVWAKLLGNPAFICFGGFISGKLISSCTLAIIPNLTRGCRPYALVENVVTHTDYRRQGHGKKLLNHTLTTAWEAGCYKAMLMTGRKDEATLAFYESVGFDPRAKQAFVAKPGK